MKNEMSKNNAGPSERTDGRIDVMEMRCQGFFDSAMCLSSQLRNHNSNKPITLGANVFSRKLEFGGCSTPDGDDLDDWHFASKGGDSPSKGGGADLSKLVNLKTPKQNIAPHSPGHSSVQSRSHHSLPEAESDNASIHSAASRNNNQTILNTAALQEKSALNATRLQQHDQASQGMSKLNFASSYGSGCGKLPTRANVFRGDEIDEENEDDVSLCWNPDAIQKNQIYEEEEEPVNEEDLEDEIARIKEECFLYGQWLQEFDPRFVQAQRLHQRF
jgi:hypothetical protein